MYDVPLYPTKTYPLFEATRGLAEGSTAQQQRKQRETSCERTRLKPVTWCLGDKPCRTLRKQAGSWVDVTR